MNKYTQRIIAIITLINLVGCTSMQQVENTDASLKDNLKTGDYVFVQKNTGRTEIMILTKISDHQLEGTDPYGTDTFQVNINDIEKIEVKKWITQKPRTLSLES